MTLSYAGKTFTGCGDIDIYYKSLEDTGDEGGGLVKKIFLNSCQVYQRYEYTYHEDIRCVPITCSETATAFMCLIIYSSCCCRIHCASVYPPQGKIYMYTKYPFHNNICINCNTGCLCIKSMPNTSTSAYYDMPYTFKDGYSTLISISIENKSQKYNRICCYYNTKSCTHTWTEYNKLNCSYYAWTPV